MSRKLEITIQTNRLVTIRGGRSSREWCQRCNAEREMVTLETAALLAESIATVLKAGPPPRDWHISQAPDGSPRICLPSVLRIAGMESKLTKDKTLNGLLPKA